MSAEVGKRITLRPIRPNPLFQQWLEELYQEALVKHSKLASMLKKALDSLSKYPLPLQSGADCIVLKGFDNKLCLHLDQRLAASKWQSEKVTPLNIHSNVSNNQGSSPMSDRNQNTDNRSVQSPNNDHINSEIPNSASNSEFNSQETNSSNNDNNSKSNSPNKNKSKTKTYKPAHRSGGYAILIALLEHSNAAVGENSLSKEELVEKAQKHSEESFVRPKPDSFYTAWSNMSRLVSKGLVKKIKNKKVKYILTKEGLDLAKELLEDSKKIPSVNDIIFNDAPSTSNRAMQDDDRMNVDIPTSSQSDNEPLFELEAGSFDIILLIDKQETGGANKKNDPTIAQFNKYNDLLHEYRSLKVGDFTWIARHKVNKSQELVLPYIIERKRMDDLGASIKDGRFHEQKFRLRKCGLSNVIYLVENVGSNKHVGLPIQSLMQALANTRVQDGFKVHITDSLTNSARFLAMMTKRLTIRYKDKNLKGCNENTDTDYLMTFNYFNKASSKTKALSVTETFIKLLLQLKGLSVEKALAITAKYSTPRSLIIAYQKCDSSEGEILLTNLKYGSGRNVGPTASKAIYQLFSNIGIDA